MGNKYTPDGKIKAILSEYVLNLSDKSKEQVLRKIIFSNDFINWQKVKDIICENMPELTKEF